MQAVVAGVVATVTEFVVQKVPHEQEVMKRLLTTRWPAKLLSILLQLTLLYPAVYAQEPEYVFRAETELVLVNVTVRDKNGNFVRNLKPEDFNVLEDGKPQKVVSFDIENTDAIPSTDVAQVKLLNRRVKNFSGSR